MEVDGLVKLLEVNRSSWGVRTAPATRLIRNEPNAINIENIFSLSNNPCWMTACSPPSLRSLLKGCISGRPSVSRALAHLRRLPFCHGTSLPVLANLRLSFAAFVSGGATWAGASSLLPSETAGSRTVFPHIRFPNKIFSNK